MQARRASSVADGELVYIGELFYDDVNERIGVFPNKDATTISWYPSFKDNGFFLDHNLVLGSLKSDLSKHSLVLEWLDGFLRIRNIETNTVIVQFSEQGMATKVAPTHITSLSNSANLMINGDLSVRRTVGFEPSFSTITAEDQLIAPNWVLHIDDDSASGSLTTSFDNTDVLLPNGIVNQVLSVNSFANPNKCGVRSFIYDVSFIAGRSVTFAINVKGTAGELAKVRILRKSSGAISVLTETNVVGTGNFEEIILTALCMPSEWIAIEFYEPGYSSPDPTFWKIGGLRANIGDSIGMYERRIFSVEKALVDDIYQEGRVFIADDNVVAEIPSRLGYTPNQIDFVNPTDGEPEASNIDNLGFSVSIPDLTDVDGSMLKYAAYVLCN